MGSVNWRQKARFKNHTLWATKALWLPPDVGYTVWSRLAWTMLWDPPLPSSSTPTQKNKNQNQDNSALREPGLGSPRRRAQLQWTSSLSYSTREPVSLWAEVLLALQRKARLSCKSSLTFPNLHSVPTPVLQAVPCHSPSLLTQSWLLLSATKKPQHVFSVRVGLFIPPSYVTWHSYSVFVLVWFCLSTYGKPKIRSV